MPTAPDERKDELRGSFAAFGAFLIWGAFPLYWKQLERYNSLELIAHRVVWSLAFILLVFFLRPGGLGRLAPILRQRRVLVASFLSGGFLTINWFVYVWSVNHGYIIAASLGYFLVPLFNVGIGAGLLGERLRLLQWFAIGFAAAGVVLLLVAVGAVPWISLVLAATWALYGVMRKRAALGSDDGLFAETLLYAPLAAAYLLWREHAGIGILGQAGLGTRLYVVSAGWVTAVPLLLFAYGARRIRFSTLGLLQYVTPTGQFLVGLLVYHETFDAARLRACAFIWCGLALYTADSFWAQRRALLRLAPG